MHPFALSDIYRIEYEEEGIGDYFWIHPKLITGFDTQSARALAVQRDSNGGDNPSLTENEFEETPDTLITDYLAKCLVLRSSHIKSGLPLPSYLNVTPLEYIEAVLYLITELGSSYACYVLGATHFHDDKFLLPQDAKPVLERLRVALQASTDKRTLNLIRDFTLEIFHLGYPWNSNNPRFADVLTDEEKTFLEILLAVSPLPPNE